MKYIPFPDSYIHPRSNQPAKGHAGRMAEIKFFHIFKYTVDDEVRWATKKENIYKKYDVVSSYKMVTDTLVGYMVKQNISCLIFTVSLFLLIESIYYKEQTI